MPGTTITVNPEQRDSLYELVRNHLGSIGDLFDALEREKDFAKAERLGLGLAKTSVLMQDLGWAEDEGRDGAELTMPPHDLMEVLQRLHGEAGLILARAEDSAEDAETNRGFQRLRGCSAPSFVTLPSFGLRASRQVGSGSQGT